MLGDAIEKALTRLGITKDRIERWLGAPCNCEERQRKLNALSLWAYRVLGGKTERAGDYLHRITEEQ